MTLFVCYFSYFLGGGVNFVNFSSLVSEFDVVEKAKNSGIPIIVNNNALKIKFQKKEKKT